MVVPLERGSGDQFSVNPQMLRDAAPTYYHAAQDINTLQQSLVGIVQMEFAQLASRLEQLQARIDASMQCASVGLNRVGVALSIAADEYTETDQEVSSTFTRIENDTNQMNLPPITFPSINMPGENPGSVPPMQPKPGVQNPQKPIEPQPNPWFPFLPEI